MNYKGYEITIVNDPESWNGIKSVKARRNYDDYAFDYFYLNGVPVGSGRFAPFQSQEEAEETVRSFIDMRTDADIIHEHYHILMSWNKKIEPLLLKSQEAFDGENYELAEEKLAETGRLKIRSDERWRKSLLEHLKRMSNKMS